MLGLAEPLGLFCFFLLLAGLLTRGPGAGLALAGFLLVLALTAQSVCRGAWNEDGRALGLAVIGLGLGLWVFTALRAAGLAAWPLAAARSLAQYFSLFVSHLLFFFVVFSATVWVAGAHIPLELFRFGSWRTRRAPWLGKAALAVSAALVWAWALAEVIQTRPAGPGAAWAFFLLALAKACLTGLGEEAAWRGLVLPLAVKRLGPAAGLVFQAALYAAFHIHLGAALVHKGLFLAAVFGLGLGLGAVSLKTRGIGWAALIHIGLNVVIEWRNIS